MGNLVSDVNLQERDTQNFKFVEKNQTSLYTFENKNVQAFYNILLNYVGDFLE